jgi:UDP:flavonoid glycosyltransferase YjiC (YdhE family)
VPLIARRSPLSRSQARRRLGLPEGRPAALLSFGGIGFTGFDAAGLARSAEILFVTTEPVERAPANLLHLERAGLDYTTLLRACDVVVTKPGYGITAASLVNGVRVLYTSRGDFPEYPILVAALESHGTARFVDPERLRRGVLGADLYALLARPVADSSLESHGDEVVARMILEQLDGTRA